MNRNKVGGRPTKSDAVRRKHSIQLRLSAEELLFLNSGVRKSGMERCDYIRKLITTTRITPRLTPQMQGQIRQLIGMANNLNQIARKANAAGYATARTEYLHLANRIDNLINEMEK